MRRLAGLAGGVTDADTKARGRQSVECVGLRLAERANPVIAGHHFGRRRDGILLVEHGVGDGDGEVADGGRVDDVAQVEKNLAAAVLDQLADHLAQDRAAFTQSDLAAKVHYGHVANFPACTL